MGEDRDLSASLAHDLDAAFESLVWAYQDRLYAFAARMTGDHHDAEEIAQDAFVRAYRALAGYDRKRISALELRPWLYTIALNAVRNRKRGAKAVLVSLDGGDRRPLRPRPRRHRRRVRCVQPGRRVVGGPGRRRGGVRAAVPGTLRASRLSRAGFPRAAGARDRAAPCGGACSAAVRPARHD